MNRVLVYCPICTTVYYVKDHILDDFKYTCYNSDCPGDHLIRVCDE